MKRKLDNWLDAYMQFTTDTESTYAFNRWVGLSTIAGALRKKTWLPVGRLKVYPNLYVVLVAEPGIARKTQAITYATDIIAAVPDIKVSADSITPQALLQDLEDSVTYEKFEDGRVFRYSALSVISKEFESFIGGSGGTKMMVTLTDLFDAGETPWTHRTKQYGNTSIPAVFLNILGATTPQSLATCLSELAVGGGLTSRIIFVFADKKAKRIAFPLWSEELAELQQDLINDLTIISAMSGSFDFTESSRKYWEDWYNSYDESRASRIEDRYEFDGWYSRKPLMIQKVSMCISASERDDKLITESDIRKSINYIENVERAMGGIYKSNKATSCDNAAEVLLLDQIRKHGSIKEKHLLHIVWRDLEEGEFDKAIKNLLEAGKCVEELLTTNGNVETWYKVKEKA